MEKEITITLHYKRAEFEQFREMLDEYNRKVYGEPIGDLEKDWEYLCEHPTDYDLLPTRVFDGFDGIPDPMMLIRMSFLRMAWHAYTQERIGEIMEHTFGRNDEGN